MDRFDCINVYREINILRYKKYLIRKVTDDVVGDLYTRFPHRFHPS